MSQNDTDCKHYVERMRVWRMITMRNEGDAELLKAFVETNDSAAFAELVSRHGSLVG